MSGKTYSFPGDKLIKKIFYQSEAGVQELKIKKVFSYPGNKNVFSSGYLVTYHIDTNNTIIQEVDDGADCIAAAPTATLSGWTIHGWREDTVASGTVLPSKTCDQEGIHLYAVFKQQVTVSLVGGTTPMDNTGYKYYNNGNSIDASITLGSVAISGWTLKGYRTDTTATSTIDYMPETVYDFAADTTIYAVFYRTLTVSYDGNEATSGSTAAQTDTQWYNNGNYGNPTFTLRSCGFTKTNYVFTKWAQGSTGGTQYSAGASVALASNTTFYAIWRVASQTIATTPANFPSWGHSCSGEHYADSYQTSSSGELYSSCHTWGDSGSATASISYTVNVSGFNTLSISCYNGTWGDSGGSFNVYANGANILSVYSKQTYYTATYSIPSDTTSVRVDIVASVSCGGSEGSWVRAQSNSVTLT